MILALLYLVISALLVRLLYVKPSGRLLPRTRSRRGKEPCCTCVVLGSGGHTAEMFSLLEKVNPVIFRPRTYFVAEGDLISEGKAREFEKRTGWTVEGCDYHIFRIPRARRVGQNLLSTPSSFAKCLVACVRPLSQHLPDVVICNGPGTCLPICFLAYVLRILGVRDTRIIYVESFARVRTLSLTGKLLYPWADRFVVQWEPLSARYPKAEYYGCLV